MKWLANLFASRDTRREEPAPAPAAPPPAREVAPPGPVPVSYEVGAAAETRPPFPTVELVARTLRSMGCVKDVDAWAAVIAPACIRHDITSRSRLAAFLANVAHESAKLTAWVENLNYDNAALPGVFGSGRGAAAAAAKLGRPAGSRIPLTAERQRAIALVVYGGAWGLKFLGNRPGTDDGWVFRGHGLLQLTGRANFERFGRVIGRRAEELPAVLSTREGSAEAAAHFFAASGCLDYADLGDITTVRRLINGGSLGLEEVRTEYASALIDLGGMVA